MFLGELAVSTKTKQNASSREDGKHGMIFQSYEGLEEEILLSVGGNR
mgnify:CR=1 FL=1